MVVGRLLSYWEGNFSGAMLNFGRVTVSFKLTCTIGQNLELLLGLNDANHNMRLVLKAGTLIVFFFSTQQSCSDISFCVLGFF